MKKILVLPLGVFLFLILNSLFPISRSVYAQTIPYKIGAYYFGTWSTDFPQWKLDNINTVYKRYPDWWGGVRDFHGDPGTGVPIDTRGWTGDFSHLKPAIGYYDDQKVVTLERHIMQAKQNGLSFFNFYWYWNNSTHSEYAHEGLDAFLKASNRNDLEFMVTICTGACTSKDQLCIEGTDVQTAINTIIDKYLTQPNYMKTSDGMPIISIWNNVGINDDSLTSVQNFISTLKQSVYNRFGKYPFVLLNGDIYFAPQITNSDGYFCWVHNSRGGNNLSYTTDHIDILDEYLNRFTDKPLMYCSVAGFDERPRQDIELVKCGVNELLTPIPCPSGYKENKTFYNDFDATKYRTELQKIKQHMDMDRQSADLRRREIGSILSIYAWNEWHEGGILEPSEKNGALYLKTVAEVFGLPRVDPTNPNSCSNTGKCDLGNSLIGTFDVVRSSDCYIGGWVIDWDGNWTMPWDIRNNKYTSVAIYADGLKDQGGVFITTAQTKYDRPDLQSTLGISGPFGFRKYLNVPYLNDGKTHTLYIYGMNLPNTIGSDTLLWDNPKTIQCPVTPTCSPLQTVTGLSYSCSGDKTQATVSWNAAANARGYNIRVDDGNGITDSAHEVNGVPNNCGSVPHDICINEWNDTKMTISLDGNKNYSWWVHPINLSCEQYGNPTNGTSITCSTSPTFTPTPLIPTLTPTRTPTPTPTRTPTPTPYPPFQVVIPYYGTASTSYDFDQNGKVNMMDVGQTITR